MSGQIKQFLSIQIIVLSSPQWLEVFFDLLRFNFGGGLCSSRTIFLYMFFQIHLTALCSFFYDFFALNLLCSITMRFHFFNSLSTYRFAIKFQLFTFI